MEKNDLITATLQEKGAVNIKFLYPYNLKRTLVVGFEFNGGKHSFVLNKIELDAEKDHLAQVIRDRCEMARSFKNDFSRH